MDQTPEYDFYSGIDFVFPQAFFPAISMLEASSAQFDLVETSQDLLLEWSHIDVVIPETENGADEAACMQLQRSRPSALAYALSTDNGAYGEDCAARYQTKLKEWNMDKYATRQDWLAFAKLFQEPGAAGTEQRYCWLQTVPGSRKSIPSKTRSPPSSLGYCFCFDKDWRVHTRNAGGVHRRAEMLPGRHEPWNEVSWSEYETIHYTEKCVASPYSDVPAPDINPNDWHVFQADRGFLGDQHVSQDTWHRRIPLSTKMSPDDDDNDNHFGFCRATVQCGLERDRIKNDWKRHEQKDDWEVQGNAHNTEGMACCVLTARPSSVNTSTMALWRAAIRRICTPKASIRKPGRCLESLEPKPDGQYVVMDNCSTAALLLCA